MAVSGQAESSGTTSVAVTGQARSSRAGTNTELNSGIERALEQTHGLERVPPPREEKEKCVWPITGRAWEEKMQADIVSGDPSLSSIAPQKNPV